MKKKAGTPIDETSRMTAKKLTTETTLQRALEHENTDFKIPQRSSHDIKETIENSWRELNYF